jgi:hypothetical protein
MSRIFSPGQTLSLVLLDRFALMDRNQICTTFGVSPEWLDYWKSRYDGQTLFHAKFVEELAQENIRLRWRLKARSARMKRAASKRKFSEAQIDCMLNTITCGLASPEQVCEMYGVSIIAIRRWTVSLTAPRHE